MTEEPTYRSRPLPLAPIGRARRLFTAVGKPRWLLALAVATLLLYLAMVPSFHAMAKHAT